MPSTTSSTAAAESPATGPLPVFADIEAAAARLAGQAVVTPLLGNAALDAAVGGRVLIKPETLQRTGSFKFRGAYNKISRLAQGPQPPRAIVAYSSGNHAQGVAAAAKIAGIQMMQMTGVQLTFIPFKGAGPAMGALLSGQVAGAQSGGGSGEPEPPLTPDDSGTSTPPVEDTASSTPHVGDTASSTPPAEEE